MALKYLYAPSGVQAGKAYGVLPNSADADFSSFARSSAGSRVDENGLINTGLGLGSEEVTNGGFDTDSDWSTEGTPSFSIANGVLNCFSDGAYAGVSQNIVLEQGKTYKLELDIVRIGENSGSLNFGDQTSHILLSFVSSEDDLGKKTIYFKPERTTTIIRIYRSSACDIDLDNVSVREITEVNTNVPRLDYTGGGCPSLLLEPQSTNLFQYSESFQDWSLISNTTTVQNSSISPNGSLNALKVKGSLDNNNNGLSKFFTITAGIQSYSIFAKAGEINILQVGFGGSFGNTYANVNLTNGVVEVESNQTTIVSDFGNGWYRITSIATSSSTTGYWFINIGDDPNMGRNANYIGNASDGLFVWGAQTEQQAYATSYIPNYGTAAGVTRSADVGGSTGDLSSVINSTEGVLYAEIAALTDAAKDGTLRFISLSDGTSNKRISIYYFNAETFGIQLKDGAYEVTDLYIGGSTDRTQFNKIALYYNGNNVKAYLNGVEVYTNSSWIPFLGNTLNILTFTDGNSQSSPFYGKAKQVRIYDEALSDTELQELTTL